MDNPTDIVNLIVNNSVSVAVIGYFLFRDWKYNERQIVLLETIKTLVEKLEIRLDKEN